MSFDQNTQRRLFKVFGISFFSTDLKLPFIPQISLKTYFLLIWLFTGFSKIFSILDVARC